MTWTGTEFQEGPKNASNLTLGCALRKPRLQGWKGQFGLNGVHPRFPANTGIELEALLEAALLFPATGTSMIKPLTSDLTVAQPACKTFELLSKRNLLSLLRAITLENTLVILSTVAPDAGRYYVQAVNDKNGDNKTSQPITLTVESK